MRMTERGFSLRMGKLQSVRDRSGLNYTIPALPGIDTATKLHLTDWDRGGWEVFAGWEHGFRIRHPHTRLDGNESCVFFLFLKPAAVSVTAGCIL